MRLNSLPQKHQHVLAAFVPELRSWRCAACAAGAVDFEPSKLPTAYGGHVAACFRVQVVAGSPETVLLMYISYKIHFKHTRQTFGACVETSKIKGNISMAQQHSFVKPSASVRVCWCVACAPLLNRAWRLATHTTTVNCSQAPGYAISLIAIIFCVSCWFCTTSEMPPHQALSLQTSANLNACHSKVCRVPAARLSSPQAALCWRA